MTELVQVETADGLRLHGLFHACNARRDQNDGSRVGGTHVLLVHGTGANFYHAGILSSFAGAALSAGCSAWRINTRGHDGIASIPSRHGSVAGGATYEVISDCVYDLAAWVQAIREEGAERIVLVGHSMGAVKSIFYNAKRRPRDVDAVVALSPPRFCHENWMSHPKADAFRQSWAQAEQLLDAGQLDLLMPVTQPVPFVATPAGFLAKYGPHDDYDIIRRLPETVCPTLVLIGGASVKSSPAFDGLPDALTEVAAKRPHIDWEVIEGADISYRGCEEAASDRSLDWLRSVLGHF